MRRTGELSVVSRGMALFLRVRVRERSGTARAESPEGRIPGDTTVCPDWVGLRRHDAHAHRTRSPGASTTTNLLDGLLAVADGMAVRVLRDLGMGPDAISEQLRLRAEG